MWADMVAFAGGTDVFNRITDLFRKNRDDDEHIAVREMSSDYIDGELDDASTLRVDDHLDKCGLCRVFFNTLRATVGLLSIQKQEKAPESLKESIRKELRSHEH